MVTDEQMIEMAPRIKAMMQTPGWQDYITVIAQKIYLTQEAAIADDPSQLLYHRGSIDGLRAAILSGNDILAEVRNLTGEKREVRRRMNDAGQPSLT